MKVILLDYKIEVDEMEISNKLTQQKLQEILLDLYVKGETSIDLKAEDLIEEIKQKVLSVIHSPN